MPISMTALTWMVRRMPNRNTIDVFTNEIDESGFVRLQFLSLADQKLHLCMALMNMLLGECTTLPVW